MEGRWATINGAKVFINSKGDVILGMGKTPEETFLAQMSKDFTIADVDGGVKSWNDTMRASASLYRKQIYSDAKELSERFMSDYNRGKVDISDLDKITGYSGRLSDLESKKHFRESKGADWIKVTENNYRANIALYNDSAKYYEKEYKRSITFGDSVNRIVRNRVSANMAHNYALGMKKVLDDWIK